MIVALAAPLGAKTLGERYVETNLGYIEVEDVDGLAYGLGVNLPIMQQGQMGLDLGLDAGLAQIEVDDWWGSYDVEQKDLDVDLTLHVALSEVVSLFVDGGLGWVEVEIDDFSDDSLKYTSGAGIEFNITPEFSITAGGSCVWYEEGGDDWVLYVAPNYWITEHFGLGLGFGYNKEDGIEERTYSASLQYRF